MEFQARHAVEEIRKQVATTAAVMRDGREQELPMAELRYIYLNSFFEWESRPASRCGCTSMTRMCNFDRTCEP
jgi:hypothetical protein